MLTEGDIGQRVRELRELRALSQNDVAEATGISKAQVSQIETGAYVPSFKALVRLLDVLDAELEIELRDGAERRLNDPIRSSEPPARPTP
jgi:transcriptional regulator with XRE-family HTH domain